MAFKLARAPFVFAAVFAGSALWPTAALANAGIGYFMVAMPVVLLALVPAIAIEAGVLRAMLAIGWKRGAALAFRANLLSTLYGVVAGIALDFLLTAGTGSAGFPMVRWGAALSLVPWFAFSWWIEFRVVAKRATELPRASAWKATGAANALTYALMAAFTLFSPFLPERDPSVLRARVSEGLLAASDARGRVDAYWQANRRLPDDPRDLGASSPSDRYLVTLAPGGRIAITFRTPKDPEIDGKHVDWTPIADPGAAALRWVCSSRDIERGHLPGSCRNPSP